MITMYPAKVNSPATRLASGINAVVDIIPLDDSSVMPAAPNLAALGTGEDTETILYGSINGNNLETVTRGFQGTAKAWDSGTAVARLFTAYDLDTLRANLATHDPAVTGVHGVGAGVVAKVGDIAVDGNLSAAAQDAIAKKHTQGTDTALGAVGTKDPPIDADKALYRDSAAADALVTSTWTQIKTFLKTYFDTVYRLATADHSHQSAGAQAGKLDHGLALNGLADDDHPQYLKDVVDDATPQLGGDLDAEGHKIHDQVAPYAAKAAAYTTTVDDEIIAVDTTFGAVTITLGSAACRAGQVIVMKDKAGNAGTLAITIDTEGAELIDSAATDTINRDRFSKQYYSDGTNWLSYSLTDDNDVYGLLEQGLFANIPGAGSSGRLYFATDTKELWRDTGFGWTEILRGETATRLAQLSEKSHASLTDLGADDHPQYTLHSLATAASDFLVASGAGVFIKKTLAEVKTLLGIAADIATHAAIKSANATLGHVIVENASKVDVDGDGKLTLGSDVLLEADLENPPTENEAAKAPTSEWAFDHNARDATAAVQGHATAAQITKLDGIEAEANRINWITVKHFWTFGTHISSTPRTATISGIAGDVITLSAAHAYKFYQGNMDGNVYVKIANTSKSPSEYAWVMDAPAANTLQVTDAADIVGWANTETISTAKDGAASAFVELDLSPNTDIPAGATAIYARIFNTDTGAVAAFKGVDLWHPDMTGAFLVAYMQATDATFTVFGFISIDSNKHIIVRDRATGADTLQPGAVIMAYMK